MPVIAEEDAAQPEAVPLPAAQLGLAAPATGRAPQKYLIQNQSGLRVYYWADKVGSGSRHLGPWTADGLPLG